MWKKSIRPSIRASRNISVHNSAGICSMMLMIRRGTEGDLDGMDEQKVDCGGWDQVASDLLCSSTCSSEISPCDRFQGCSMLSGEPQRSSVVQRLSSTCLATTSCSLLALTPCSILDVAVDANRKASVRSQYLYTPSLDTIRQYPCVPGKVPRNLMRGQCYMLSATTLTTWTAGSAH